MFGPIAVVGTQHGVGSSSIPIVTSSRIVSRTIQGAPKLPFIAGLSLLDFSQLINNPIHHDASWPSMLTMLPLDIPKFEGNDGEDPTNHVYSFHMWCLSNSIADDYIRLRLFECTLTGDATKWYVDQLATSHSIFVMLYK